MATQQEILNLLHQQQYEQIRQKLLQLNMAYAQPNWQEQLTVLPSEQETAFQQWLKTNNVNYNPADKYPDYDMRGYYQSLQQGQAEQPGVNPVDLQLHYPDTYKTPYHESFSSESKWALPGAPSWQGEKLISPAGEIIFETEPQK